MVRPIGQVESPLRRPEGAPKQGTKGGPEAWVVLEGDVEAAGRNLRAGDEVYLLTWLHRGHATYSSSIRDDPLNPS